ncbi:MAG: MarR family winged helix-turn-helix transcriptional regulator [Paracoccaceae bacterium]
MTDTSAPTSPGPGPGPGKGSASYRAPLALALARQGFSPAAVESMLDFDAEHFLYVRRVMKGNIPQALMDELGAGLDVPQFHALSAIMRIRGGYGRPAPQEPTVGLLAEDLCLDPSRASRIAADLVSRGLVSRSVSQEDGRRSILVPTEAGLALMQGFFQAKWQRTARVFADWSEDEITCFARLFARYSEGMRQQYPTGSAGAAES